MTAQVPDLSPQSFAALQQTLASNELAASLARQTATDEILRAMSSAPSDLQSVLDAVAENAARVCGAADAVILRPDGDHLRVVAKYGPLPEALNLGAPFPSRRQSVAGRAVLDRTTIHVDDLAASLSDYPDSRALQEYAGTRTILAQPLLRGGLPIGVIVIRRLEGPSLHRCADCAAGNLRRSGRHCHRELPPLQRATGPQS